MRSYGTSSSSSAFIHSKGVFTVWTGVGHLVQAVYAVRDEAAPAPQAEDTEDEGSDVLDETGVSPDGCGHLLVTPRTHQGHGVRSKLRALLKYIVIVK